MRVVFLRASGNGHGVKAVEDHRTAKRWRVNRRSPNYAKFLGECGNHSFCAAKNSSTVTTEACAGKTFPISTR